MPGYVGLDCVLVVDYTGGGYVSAGRAESAELAPDQSLTHLDGATGQSSAIYGMIEPRGSATLWVQSLGLLSYCQRTVVNGLPPVISAVEGGVLGDAVWKQEDVYIDSVELSMEKGGALQAAVEWVALYHTVGSITTGATPIASNRLLAWHTADVQLGGDSYGCQSIRARLENGLKLDTDLDGKTAGYERFPVVCKPGLQSVTVEIEFATAPDVNLYSATPTTAQIVYTAHDSQGTPATFRHTVSNLHPVSLPVPIVRGDEEVVWKLSLEADHNDLTAWSTPTLA